MEYSIKTNKFLQMDAYTRFNLELTRTIRSDDRFGSLLWILDKTKTAMGSRLLKSYIISPSVDKEVIIRTMYKDNSRESNDNLVNIAALINGDITYEQ